MEAKRPASPIALGTKLRQAREARGLSIDDVAQALRLSARIVAALEDDAFERLPGPTYARGYLRNYAQFLGLSPQPLIDAYNNLPAASQRADISGLAPVHQVTSSDILVRLGTVAVAVIVLGLAALWWSGHEATTVYSPPSATRSAPSSEAASDRPVAPVVPEPRPNADITDATPAPSNEPAASMNQAAAPVPPPAVKPEPAPTPPPPARASEPESAPAPAPATTTTATAPSAASNLPTARLVLYVHEDSWADVRDAQQHRLLYETIPAGRVVTVEGVAPLSVFLGNVEGVTVEFNGQTYDAMRHKRGQVARFTLGSPQG